MQGQLDELAETPYLSPRLNSFLQQLQDVAGALSARLNQQPTTIAIPVAHKLVGWVWTNTQYLAGSTAKRIPFEVVFALETAAREWSARDLVITTALRKTRDFHLLGPDPAIAPLIAAETGITLSAEVVQSALPEIYRHRPLYCIALYHELGHFVDIQSGITNSALLLSTKNGLPPLPGLPRIPSVPLAPQPTAFALRQHLMEYFADLFSACYMGETAIRFLQEFAPGHAASPTHPATADRTQLMNDFLTGTSNPVVNMFQDALKTRGKPPLKQRFSVPHITESFADARPYAIASESEIHGLFVAGWSFIDNLPAMTAAPWANADAVDVEGITNDLVEKSIRNYMIREAWGATSQ